MAKKAGGSKTADGARKAAKPKKAKRAIPKRVGGVKLPKALRESGDALLARAATPAGRQVIAAGLTMAASAAAAAITRERSGAKAPRAGKSEGSPAGGAGDATVDPAKLADAVSAAANAFLAGFMGNKR